MASYSDPTFSIDQSAHQIARLVCSLRFKELQKILSIMKQDKNGSKQCLVKRILIVLCLPFEETIFLRKTIIDVVKARSESNYQSQRPQNPQIHAPSNNVRFPNRHLQNAIEVPANPYEQFGNLPFFKFLQTLLEPIQCQPVGDKNDLDGHFILAENVRHALETSWSDIENDYTIRVILRFKQVERNENVADRLPYNISVKINDITCELPDYNFPKTCDIRPWRNNDPIDITHYVYITNNNKNELKITWSDEPQLYMVALFVVKKLTWSELLKELEVKPLRAYKETKMLIRDLMISDADMGVSSMLVSLMDPLSKKRMKLPARGVDCKHLQCFDAIQFLQMNERKQTWLCPLCNKKVKFENMKVDAYFLSIIQNKHLSNECKNVTLLKDGSWTGREPISNILNSNGNQSGKQIEVITLKD